MPQSKKTIILGIDPGLADTGYGVIGLDNGKCAVIDYGNITTGSRDTLESRLDTIHKALEKIIEKNTPDIAAVEKLFFAKNAKTALVVGHARGAILLTLGEKKVVIREFTPLQIKQALTNYGRATKKQIQEMVRIILGLRHVPKPDDAADALAAAICCAHTFQETFYEQHEKIS